MNESKKLKKTVKNRWDCVEIFMCACECLSMRVFVWVIVVYYCVWMSKWCLVYVYVKIYSISQYFCLEVNIHIAQSAGAVEYTDCFSVEE